MNKWYVMKALSSEDAICLKLELSDLRLAVLKSELQFLDQKELMADIAEEGGFERNDFLYQEGIYFVSDRMKQTLEALGIDYLFFKKVRVVNETYGIHELFWMMLPPRIDCLDLEECEGEKEWDLTLGLIPRLNLETVVINPKRTGHFEMFQIFGVLDNHIYVTEDLAGKLKENRLKGLALVEY